MSNEAISISPALRQTVAERLMRLKDDIAASITSHGLTASGRTAASLRVSVSDNEVALWGRSFFPALETGSSRWEGRTGVRCTFAEFRRIIADWATAKGLNLGQAKEFDRTVAAIAMSIIRRGTAQKRRQRLDVYSTLIDNAVSDCVDLMADVANAAVDNCLAKWK